MPTTCMLNLRKDTFTLKKSQQIGYIHLVLLQFKTEYRQQLIRPYVCQYNVKSKIYECLN